MNYIIVFIYTHCKIFFTSTNFNYNNSLGRSFLCPFQMSNHLPGKAYLTRDELLDSELKNMEQYQDLFTCFKHPRSFYSQTLRLFHKTECKTFFKMVKKRKFKKRMRKETLYTLKNLDSQTETALDFLELQKLTEKYKGGKLCGEIKEKHFLREYIWNQLHYKNGEKFRLRTFLVVISAHPLLVVFNRGYAIHERFNNSTTVAKDSIDLEELFDFLHKDRGITRKKFDLVYKDIKGIAALLTSIVQKKLFRDPRFYQVFAMDFILDDKLTPWLVDINDSPNYRHKNANFVNNLIQLTSNINSERSNRMLVRINQVKHHINQRIFNKSLESKYWSKFVPEMKNLVKEKLGKWEGLMRNRLPGNKTLETSNFEVIYDETKMGSGAYKRIIPQHCF